MICIAYHLRLLELCSIPCIVINRGRDDDLVGIRMVAVASDFAVDRVGSRLRSCGDLCGVIACGQSVVDYSSGTGSCRDEGLLITVERDVTDCLR